MQVPPCKHTPQRGLVHSSTSSCFFFLGKLEALGAGPRQWRRRTQRQALVAIGTCCSGGKTSYAWGESACPRQGSPHLVGTHQGWYQGLHAQAWEPGTTLTLVLRLRPLKHQISLVLHVTPECTCASTVWEASTRFSNSGLCFLCCLV